MKILLVNLKYLYIFSMPESQSWKNRNQNVKVEKMVVLVKTFDHYHHKFQLSCKIVKKSETEIQIEI